MTCECTSRNNFHLYKDVTLEEKLLLSQNFPCCPDYFCWRVKFSVIFIQQKWDLIFNTEKNTENVCGSQEL